MGQDRVRPLALALQGLDYTVRGQTEEGGFVCVCVLRVGWQGGRGVGGSCGSSEGAVDAERRRG